MSVQPTETISLGTKIEDFSWQPNQKLVVAVAFALLGAMMLLPGAVLVSINPVAGLIPAAVGAIFILISILSLRSHRRIPKLRLAWHEGGIIYTYGENTRTVPWEDIVAVWKNHSLAGRNRYVTYAYHLRDGSRITLPSLRYLPGMMQQIEEQITKRLLPVYTQSYDQGQKLQFGKLTISKVGITDEQGTLPWDQVESVKYTDYGGFLSLNKRDRSKAWNFAVGEFVNIDILLTLLERTVKVERKRW